MAASRAWPEMGTDEWVRQSWPARCRMDDSSGVPYLEGTLTLTNRRLFFTGPVELDEVPIFDFADLLLVVRWQRRCISHSVIVETPSGQRFDFRTKKLACKQIMARSQMRRVTTLRSPVVRLGPTADEAGLTIAT